MGDWSDYFEDFPEENDANYVNGVFNPILAQEINCVNAKRDEKVREINEMVINANITSRNKIKARSLLKTEDCPQCGLDELNVYKIRDDFYLCECQECHIHGKGNSHLLARKNTSDGIGEFKDWREDSKLIVLN